MLPETGGILERDFEVTARPSKSYRLDGKHVRGAVDGLEAVRQAVYCILNTERYENVIYSWNYGVELKDLIGKPSGIVKSKLKKRIREALMQDDRITGVDAFSFTQEGRKLHALFTVHTNLGNFESEKEVVI